MWPYVSNHIFSLQMHAEPELANRLQISKMRRTVRSGNSTASPHSCSNGTPAPRAHFGFDIRLFR